MRNFLIILLLIISAFINSQEAEFQTTIVDDIKQIQNNQKMHIDKANKFVEEFIQPIMTGQAYDITISNVQLLSEYQDENIIKCNFGGMYTQQRCLDEVAYIAKYDNDYFTSESNTNIVLPFDYIVNKNNMSSSKSIIIQFGISLKPSFQNLLIKYLDESTDGKDILSYSVLPSPSSGEWSQNNYANCNGPNGTSFNNGHCKGSLALYGGNLPEWNYSNWENRETFVIDFVDRQKKIVTYYNLSGFRQALVNGRKNRFLVDICESFKSSSFFKEENQMSTNYIHSEYVQFDDILVSLNDSDKNIYKEIIINTQQMTDYISTSFSDNRASMTPGIELANNYIFTYRLGGINPKGWSKAGTNIFNRKYMDHLGPIGTIGHLITDRKDDMEKGCSNMKGTSMQMPAFSIVSNYEYNLIVPVNSSELDKLNSVDIKYVPGLSSWDKQLIIR